jgi:hypothetical protein
MGLDFLRRTAKASRKAWSNGRSDLSNPTLFSHAPSCQTRTVLADADDDAKLSCGEAVTLHMDEQGILVVREKTRIGRVCSPPPDLVAAMRDAGGCALGSIRQVNELSGTLDVEIQ